MDISNLLRGYVSRSYKIQNRFFLQHPLIWVTGTGAETIIKNIQH